MTAIRRVFELFKAGTHTDMNGKTLTFSADDIRRMERAFSPTVRPAPLCPGHPDDDRPELGHVESLHTDETGTSLFAQAIVSPTLAQAVKDRAITAVSACFFSPGQSGNPEPWAFYLKHVGFLWAHVKPAVKDLAPLSFGAPGGWIAFSAPDSPHWNQDPVKFSAPAGYAVDADRMAMHLVAQHHMSLCPGLSYSEAVRRAFKHI